jgi:hypothetical protein
VPFEELGKDGDAILNLFGGMVKIAAPFNANACTSTNNIVLSKIQNMLDE